MDGSGSILGYCSLDYPSAETGGAVNDGASVPVHLDRRLIRLGLLFLNV